MLGKSTEEMIRGEKPIETNCAHPGPRGYRAPRGRLLALHRGPAAPRQPCHARARRDVSQLRGRQPDGQQRLYHQLKSMLGHLGMHPDHLIPGMPTSRPPSPSPASPTRPAPAGSAMTPRRRCSTSTARRTSSTTSTSSTPASSQHRRREPGADRHGQRDYGSEITCPNASARHEPGPAQGEVESRGPCAERSRPSSRVNPVPWARAQMAFTLAFHIVLVPLGVSWAFMTLVANYRPSSTTTPTRSCSPSDGRSTWR